MFCTGWFLIYFLCDSENDLKFAICFVQPNFNLLSNVANAFTNSYSALRFQQVEKRCNVFSMHFRLISYAGFSQIFLLAEVSHDETK